MAGANRMIARPAMPDLPLTLCAFGLVAAFYGSVGHGGASGYLAVMALCSFAPETLRPTALTLNLVVSFIGSVLFFRAGHFSWRLFWPFALTSIPCAWLGGRLDLPDHAFKLLLALALAFSALRLLFPEQNAAERRPAALVWTLAIGALIGLVSGLIGVGGGIFLTPLILFARWADAKTAAAVSAPFIFVNSVAGLAGHSASLHHLSPEWPWLALVVVVGGFFGAHWGSIRARAGQLRPALALVLGVAALKLVVT
jgi:uncharacterized protein